MPKKYIKYLKRLPKNRRKKLSKIIDKIEILELEKLDIKKLSGFKNLFRCRLGKIRIVFEKRNNLGQIIEIDTRGDVY